MVCHSATASHKDMQRQAPVHTMVVSGDAGDCTSLLFGEQLELLKPPTAN